jgi:hypothetical protein
MIIEAALQSSDSRSNNEATSEDASSAPLCYASTIRSSELCCSKRVGMLHTVVESKRIVSLDGLY